MKTCKTTQAGKPAMTIRHLTALVLLFLVCTLPAFAVEGTFTETVHKSSEVKNPCLTAELNAVGQAVNSFFGTQYSSEVKIKNNKVDISQISAQGQGKLRYEVSQKTHVSPACTVTIIARASTSNRGSAPEAEVSTDPDPEPIELTWRKCEKEDNGPACALAEKHYKKACDGGSAAGCSNLGVMYQQGTGVDQSYPTAVKYYKKACDGGDAEGCHNLGVMYESGTGVDQSYPTAVKYYKKACDGGNAWGCLGLGFMYREGRGVKQSDTTAVEYYKKGCDGGDATGCTNLGLMYEGGKGVDQSDATAVKYYKKACDGGSAAGCGRAARLQ